MSTEEGKAAAVTQTTNELKLILKKMQHMETQLRELQRPVGVPVVVENVGNSKFNQTLVVVVILWFDH